MAVLLAAAVVPVANAVIINVPGDEPTIQAGIDAAVNGDEVVVAEGTYFEAINFNGKAITLRSSGGADVTTIDGTGNFHVVQCVSGEGPDTVLDGFTITGGDANGGSFFDKVGGGMFNSPFSSPTVTNCTFSGNTALQGGGGMFNIDSNPTVTNCTFSGNSADFEGGGMYNSVSSPTVTNCTFVDNTVTGEGGGMSNEPASNPTVTNCSFSGNSADFDGGGMASRNGSSPTVTNCSFSGNTASDRGGGMASLNGSSPTVTGCSFEGNSAGGNGGGMFNDGSSLAVTNCTFSGNSAVSGGGGVLNSGSSLIVTNSILWDDSPDEITGGTPTVTYSDVQGGFTGTGNINVDPMFVDPGNGDFRLAPASPGIDAGDNNGVDGCGDCDEPDPDNLPGCSDVDCEAVVCAIDPFCCDGEWDSICAKEASGLCGCTSVITDLDGNPRFVDDPNTPDCPQAPGTCGDPPVVDMGAYEFQVEPPCPWDCDSGERIDGTVGIVDFLTLLGQWGGPGSCDFDGGGVGITDFLELLANWGPCP